ncbi:hypothetical protein LDL36_05930 [Komagataeibacter sp. FNDCR1]|nr:hypothetical protein [Komagataeibacter sp. FNDCR1]
MPAFFACEQTRSARTGFEIVDTSINDADHMLQKTAAGMSPGGRSQGRSGCDDVFSFLKSCCGDMHARFLFRRWLHPELLFIFARHVPDCLNQKAT